MTGPVEDVEPGESSWPLVAHPAAYTLTSAGTWGERTFGPAARGWAQDLLVGHFMASLRRHHYDDNPYSRVRQHTLIMGPRSEGKTSTALAFYSGIVGATPENQEWRRALALANKSDPSGSIRPLHASRSEARRRWRKAVAEGNPIYEPGIPKPDTIMARPHLYDLGSGTSFEKLRGSTDEIGRVLIPPLSYSDYVVIPELFEVLDPDPVEAARRAMRLNRVLEEANIVVDLVKGGGVDEGSEAYDHNAEVSHRYGIEWDPDRGVYRYRTPSTFVACSIPPEGGEDGKYSTLYEWGFISRFTLSPYDALPEAQLEDSLHPFGRAPEPVVEMLRNVCLRVWLSEWTEVNQPGDHITAAIDGVIHSAKKKAWQDMRVEPVRFMTKRERGDMVRMATFAAMARTLGTTSGLHEGPLVYDESDARFAIGMTQRLCLNKLLRFAQTAESADEQYRADWHRLEKFVESQCDDGEDPPLDFEVDDFVSFLLNSGDGATRREAWRTVGRIHGNGWLTVNEIDPKRVQLYGDAYDEFIGRPEEYAPGDEPWR